MTATYEIYERYDMTTLAPLGDCFSNCRVGAVSKFMKKETKAGTLG